MRSEGCGMRVRGDNGAYTVKSGMFGCEMK